MVRSTGEMTDRTDVAEMTSRSVSWKEDRRSGQAVMRLLESMFAFPSLIVVIASISDLISSSKNPWDRM